MCSHVVENMILVKVMGKGLAMKKKVDERF